MPSVSSTTSKSASRPRGWCSSTSIARRLSSSAGIFTSMSSSGPDASEIRVRERTRAPEKPDSSARTSSRNADSSTAEVLWGPGMERVAESKVSPGSASARRSRWMRARLSRASSISTSSTSGPSKTEATNAASAVGAPEAIAFAPTSHACISLILGSSPPCGSLPYGARRQSHRTRPVDRHRFARRPSTAGTSWKEPWTPGR